MVERVKPVLKSQGFIIVLLLVGALGFAFLWINTQWWGIGVGYDSVFYLSAADNFLAGLGLSRLDGYGNVVPLTHFPPLYPFLLALTSFLTGSSTVDAARLLAALAFGCHIFGAGWVVHRYTKSFWAGLFAGVFLLASPILLGVHWMAMSEPAYLVLQLSMLAVLTVYVAGQKRWALVAAAVLAGLAYLTRYVGIALIGAGGVALLFLGQRSYRQKLKDALLFGLISALPILLWYLRNWLLTGSMTNRAAFFHLPEFAQIQKGLITLSLWCFPATIPGIARILLFALGMGILLIVFVRWFRRSNPFSAQAFTADQPFQFVFLLTLYVAFYLTFLFVSLTFFDASTRLNTRILSPCYALAVVWALIVLGYGLSGRKPAWLRVGVFVLALGLLSLNLARSLVAAADMRINGSGFTGKSWQTSETIAAVNQLPPGIVIFSNKAFPIYFVTGRPSNGIPERVDVVKGQSNQDYDLQIAAMRETIIEMDGALVIFDSTNETGVYPPLDQLIQGLTLWRDTADGAVYRSP